MNKIRINVDRNINYIYHMNAVANSGADNDYGRNYARLHKVEDLEVLKQHGGKQDYSPEVSEVLKGNFDIYIYNVWYEVKSELMEYAESLQKKFNESDFTEREDEAAGISSKEYFTVYLCNSIVSNEEDIFTVDGKLLVGTDQTVDDAFAYIQRAYVRYLNRSECS